MKKIMLISFVFAYTIQSSAMEVLVTTDQPVSPEKMTEIIDALPDEIKSKEVHSLFDYELREPYLNTTHEKIALLISQGEEESLNGRFRSAIQKYELLLKELDGIPNILGMQKIRQNAFAKTAELYTMLKDSEKSDIFWARVQAWDPKGVLDPEVFSPKSILKLRTLKSLSSFKAVKIKAPPFSAVFWNGKKLPPFEKFHTIKVNPGKHQLAVLVPGSLWQIKNFNVTKNSPELFFQFVSQPVVDGDCGNPVLANYNLPNGTRLVSVFDKGACSRVYDGKSWYDLKGQAFNLSKTSSTAEAMVEDSVKLERQSWLGKAAGSSWFWIGIGAVVTGTVLLTKSQESVAVPTHTSR